MSLNTTNSNAPTAAAAAAAAPGTLVPAPKPGPVSPRRPSSPSGEAEADAVNAEVLKLRGFTTTATGAALWKLARRAEDNALFEDDYGDRSDDDSDDSEQHPRDGASAAAAAAALGHGQGQGQGQGSARGDGGGNDDDEGRKKKEEEEEEEEDYELKFEPLWFFFYGSLQDPRQLRSVCGLPAGAEPALRKASIRGWRVMMWGPFPALVPAASPDDTAVVEGFAWRCESGRAVMDLCCYETANYRLERCDIELGSEDGGSGSGSGSPAGEVIRDGRVFVSAGALGDLKEGAFDLDKWMGKKSLF